MAVTRWSRLRRVAPWAGLPLARSRSARCGPSPGTWTAAGHEGPIPLESSLDWATSTASPDPCNPARRLATVRGFLRHLSALDGATEVPAPGTARPGRAPHAAARVFRPARSRPAAGRGRPGPGRRAAAALLRHLVRADRVHRTADQRSTGPDLRRRRPGRGHADRPRRQTRPDQAGAAASQRAGRRCATTPADRAAPLRPAATAARRSSAPTAATGSATTPPTTPSGCCAASWAGPRPAAPARHACTTCGIAWWSAASRPGMPRVSTSTARSRCWPPTSGTSRCATLYWYLSAVPELMSIVADRFEHFAGHDPAGAP